MVGAKNNSCPSQVAANTNRCALCCFFVARGIDISTARSWSSGSMAWNGMFVVMALWGVSHPQVSAVAFQHSCFGLSRGLRGMHMTTFRNDGHLRNFEVKHDLKCWGRPSLSVIGYSARKPNTICKALPNSSASKGDAQRFAQVLTKIAVTLGCFAGLFLHDVLAQEYNAVDRFPLVQGKVRTFDSTCC
jgi:hypothetical protein